MSYSFKIRACQVDQISSNIWLQNISALHVDVSISWHASENFTLPFELATKAWHVQLLCVHNSTQHRVHGNRMKSIYIDLCTTTTIVLWNFFTKSSFHPPPPWSWCRSFLSCLRMYKYHSFWLSQSLLNLFLCLTQQILFNHPHILKGEGGP